MPPDTVPYSGAEREEKPPVSYPEQMTPTLAEAGGPSEGSVRAMCGNELEAVQQRARGRDNAKAPIGTRPRFFSRSPSPVSAPETAGTLPAHGPSVVQCLWASNA